MPKQFHDEEERETVKQLLAGLPAAHPLQLAFGSGVETMRLSFLADDRDLMKRLRHAYVAAVGRQGMLKASRKS
jgi:hypothetical protein